MAALEAVALIRHLSHAFPNATIPPETIELYAERLASWPVSDLAHVVEAAIGDCKFFPSLAEMHELRGKLRRPIRASDRDAGEQFQRQEERLKEPPKLLKAMIESVAKSMTPDRRLLS